MKQSPYIFLPETKTKRMVVSVQFYDEGEMVIRTRKREVFETLKKYLFGHTECYRLPEEVKDCFKAYYGDGAHPELIVIVELIEG